MALPALVAVLALQASAIQAEGDPALVHANGRTPPAVVAVRTPTPIRVDGVLDEPGWAAARPVTGFRRDVPSDGEPASETTRVRVLFDEAGLYVGAELSSLNGNSVSRRLGRRDSFSTLNDVFFVMLDSHHDHQTAYVFGVTPAGGRRDAVAGGDGSGAFDPSWNPIWEASTSVGPDGWFAELRIPFSQLPFSASETSVWGIQFRRDILDAGEASDWAWSPRTEPGQASKFGHLLGLEDLSKPGRLELLPYAVTSLSLTEGADGSNPFDDGSLPEGAFGLDLKYRVSNELTLDATVNPDFGQVDADPAVVNLTAFETFFPELRPFFVEGSSVFDWMRFGHDLFYSRRIGRAPRRSALGSAPYVDQPSSTTILGAAKLSGRTRSGWSIGAIEALTAAEHARTAGSSGEPELDEPVEPLTNFGVVRIKKDRGDGTGWYGFTGTSVNRDIDDPKLDFLTRNAYSAGFDFLQRFSGNRFALTGNLAFSRVSGSTEALTAIQRSSARYFQRPDQTRLTFDPDQTTMSGALAIVTFAKQSGNWTFTTFSGFSSPGFEINDAGFQTSVDRRVAIASVSRRWLEPGRLFRNFRVGGGVNQLWNHGWDRLRNAFSMNAGGQLNNFWSVSWSGGLNLTALNDRTTRGGPLIQDPRGWSSTVSLRSDPRRSLTYGSRVRLTGDREGSWSVDVSPDLVLRPSGALTLTLSPGYRRSYDDAFYARQITDSTATTTFGKRYVFAELDRETVDLRLRVDWAVTPRMTLQFYAQPFVAAGRYQAFKEFTTPSEYAFLRYGEGDSSIRFEPDANTYTADPAGSDTPAFTFSNPDFTVRSLNTNLVLRWEYSPGSTLYVAWSQSRLGFRPEAEFDWLGGLTDVFDERRRDVLLIKASYWLNR